MDFMPPEFSILRVNTLNLDTELTRLLKRYKLTGIPEGHDPSQASQNRLDALIARILALKDCKTSRFGALEVLLNLANKYAVYSKTHNEAECNKATLFLLGALIHRYFRIIQEHTKPSVTKSVNYVCSFFSTPPAPESSCKLFVAIREALNFEKFPKGLPPDFHQKDLKVLDEATIVTALKSFRDNMTKADANNKSMYMEYPHFADPKNNFEAYLRAIIDKHEPKAAPVLRQYKAIDFVQSLAIFCEKDNKEVGAALAAWKVILKKDHPKFESLSKGELEAHIKAKMNPTVKCDPIREKILDLLDIPHIVDGLGKFNLETFFSNMLAVHQGVNNQALLGGYVLLLQSKGIGRLESCLRKALNIEARPDDLTDVDQLRAIMFMESFLKINPKAELDYEFFGGKENFDDQFAVIREAVGKRAAAQNKQEKVAAAPAPAPAMG